MKKQTVALVEAEDGRSILFCGVYEDPAAAYGNAMLEMEAVMHDANSNYHFTSIYPLESDAGYGFGAIDEKNPEYNLRALILDTDEEPTS